MELETKKQEKIRVEEIEAGNISASQLNCSSINESLKTSFELWKDIHAVKSKKMDK